MITDFTRTISIDENSAVPKHLQISRAIITAVETGAIKKGQCIPSINDLSYELYVSRGTIEKSYQNLKELGLLSSFPGKGFYIANSSLKQRRKICLLFNNISAHKKIVYDSFIETLGNDDIVDFFVYNNDSQHFKRLVDENLDKYSHFVVVPHFLDDELSACDAINRIPKDKLIILDKKMGGVLGEYGAVYENFERDIYDVFRKTRQKLANYHTIKLIFPEKSYFPKEIIKGFTSFCKHYSFNYEVIHDLAQVSLSAGELYINLIDEDLVLLIGKLVDADLKVGEDIGLISYNETPIKKILLNGITTISTDFRMLGSMAAQLILDNSKKQIAVPFDIHIRSSI